MTHAEALAIAERIRDGLAPGCLRIEIVGSIKRMDHPTNDYDHDVEILCIANPAHPRPEFGRPASIYANMLEKVIADLRYRDVIGQPFLNGPLQNKFPILGLKGLNAFYLDLFIVRPDTWGIQNVIRTGPSGFSKLFVTNKRAGGLLPNHLEYRKAPDTHIVQGSRVLDLKEERDAIEILGLGWIEPGRRHRYVKDQN